MANKNDKSDLIQFFFFTALTIVGLFALARYGLSLIDGKYINMLDAKISGYEDYIKRQWEAGAEINSR